MAKTKAEIQRDYEKRTGYEAQAKYKKANTKQIALQLNIKTDTDILKKRISVIDSEDTSKTLRKSHENPYIKKLYEKYFGEPMSHEAHEILHTNYFEKHKV